MQTMSIRSVFRCKLWLVMAMCLACLNANAQGGKGKNKKRNRPTQVKSATPKAEESQRVMCEFFEILPQFPGGDKALMEFLKKEVRQPDEAKDVKGKVVIRLTVEPSGELTHFEVLRSVHPALDKEALRVAKMMPKWIPGSIYGKLVTSRCCIVVAFKGGERGETEPGRRDK
ncbi:MAG: energy transducer TonB [Prevotella conceptionensis]